MKAMILAAGVGSRLRPLTDTIPKPMLPIAGEPLLAHTLRWLRSFGVTQIALNLHALPEVVQAGLGDGAQWDVHLLYSYEPELRGTAGAVKHLMSFFDERFVVVYGDLLVNIDLAALAAFHQDRRAVLTVGLKPTDTPASQGMIQCDETGLITRFVEKPRHWPADQRTANAGVYIVEPVVLSHIPPDQPSDWGHDILPALIAAGLPVYGVPVSGFLVDIGTPAVYAQVKDGFLR
ncbi:MAG: nucleotidyl transferase [Chloroflexi bacterium]|nr:MAG: nucleotidyl transferase [Chloroflexota bacterium]